MIGCMTALKPLILLIDIVDHWIGDNCLNLSNYQLNYAHVSPREFVKIFHRESTCSHLKDLYYYLKDNSSKMTMCQYCKEKNDTDDIFECKSKLRIYCSRECTKHDWANHKRDCESMAEYEKKKSWYAAKESARHRLKQCIEIQNIVKLGKAF